MDNDLISKIHPIPLDVYISNDILALAQFFLGQYLVTNVDGKTTIGKIVETEAYRAPDDKGSHAYLNKRTKRTNTIFGNGGKAYIYLCYGLHHMFNIVSGPKDTAHAILVRAIEPVFGVATMEERRKTTHKYNITNGPGKLCQAMGINTTLDGIKIYHKNSPVWIGHGEKIHEKDILKGPRVGIAYAEACAHWEWRFRIRNNAWTSKPDKVEY